MIVYCVEDDENIRELVSYALRSQGYKVSGFSQAKDFYRAVRQNIPDLVLLDIMLPGDDGLTILQKIRKNKNTATVPVIMMTAKSSEFDVVRGLDMGADDYVTKPFGIMELLSRIRSVLRRSHRINSRQKAGNVLTYGDITVDKGRHIVTVKGKEIALTLKEFDLLYYLMLNQGIVLTREQIMMAVWDSPYVLETRTIDMHIMSLRQKLGKAGRLIHTVRGVGYRLGDKG